MTTAPAESTTVPSGGSEPPGTGGGAAVDPNQVTTSPSVAPVPPGTGGGESVQPRHGGRRWGHRRRTPRRTRRCPRPAPTPARSCSSAPASSWSVPSCCSHDERPSDAPDPTVRRHPPRGRSICKRAPFMPDSAANGARLTGPEASGDSGSSTRSPNASTRVRRAPRGLRGVPPVRPGDFRHAWTR